MRFASFGALSLLLSTACGGSSTTPDAQAPVSVTEVSLDAEGSAASEASAEADPAAKNLALLEEMETAGVLGVLSSDQGEAFAALLGTSSMDAEIGGLEGASPGQGFGAGGLGMRGVGAGGGGTGQGTIGLGGIGTIGGGGGHGAGAGVGSGSGFGSARASTPQHQVKLDTPTVQGALDVQIVRRILRSQLGAIRYCYAKEQVQAPQLAGEVRVAFTIAANGGVAVVSVASSTLQNAAVESCVLGRVRTMMFPQPERGVVLVEVGMEFTVPPPPPPPTPPAAPPTPPPAPPASSGGAP